MPRKPLECEVVKMLTVIPVQFGKATRYGDVTVWLILCYKLPKWSSSVPTAELFQGTIKVKRKCKFSGAGWVSPLCAPASGSMEGMLV